MNIEGPMNQWHLDLLKRNRKIFTEGLNDATTRRSKLKEELESALANVEFYSGIVTGINEDIKEIKAELKKKELERAMEN